MWPKESKATTVKMICTNRKVENQSLQSWMKVKTRYKDSNSSHTKVHFQDLQYLFGLLAAQSVKNTDSSHIHAGTGRFSSTSCPGAAADLGAGYGQSLLSSGLGAGGHPVVLRVGGGGRRSFDWLGGRDLAQSLEHAALGGDDAIGGRGGRSVRRR